MPFNIDSMHLVGRLYNLFNAERGKAYVDEVGVGWGIVGRLKEQLTELVYGVNVGRKSSNKKKYLNLRAELHWKVRMLFINGLIAIPPNEKLIEQLADILYSYNSTGQLIIERKEDIKARTGESPDLADALFISYAGSNYSVESNAKKEVAVATKAQKAGQEFRELLNRRSRDNELDTTSTFEGL